MTSSSSSAPPPGSERRPADDPLLGGLEIPVLRPLLPNAEALAPYLRRIDEARVYSNFGALATEFGQRLAGVLGLGDDDVICASSGTAALMAAVLAAAGPASAERPLAACPALTFAATAVAAERCGYAPLLIDVDPQTWQLDPEALAKHPRLREIGVAIPVAPYGRPVAPAPWEAFRRATGVAVAIDAAASFVCISAAPRDWIGDVPLALSFHATKSFGVGEGGAVVWRRPQAAPMVLRALNFGFYGSRDSQASGLNGKLSEFHAAVGLAELDGWPAKLARLTSRVARYRQAFADVGPGAFLGYPDVDPSYPLYLCASVDDSSCVQAALTRAGVGFRLWYGGGLHKHSHFAAALRDPLPVCEAIAPRLIGLPMAPDLSDSRIGAVVLAVAQGLAHPHDLGTS